MNRWLSTSASMMARSSTRLDAGVDGPECGAAVADTPPP
jgi:hypothetical protein